MKNKRFTHTAMAALPGLSFPDGLPPQEVRQHPAVNSRKTGLRRLQPRRDNWAAKDTEGRESGENPRGKRQFLTVWHTWGASQEQTEKGCQYIFHNRRMTECKEINLQFCNQ